MHTQPAFRRANPEGGFISVSSSFHITLDLRVANHKIASARPDEPSPIHLPYLQPELQLRIFKEPPSRVDQTQQGRQERWIRQ